MAAVVRRVVLTSDMAPDIRHQVDVAGLSVEVRAEGGAQFVGTHPLFSAAAACSAVLFHHVLKAGAAWRWERRSCKDKNSAPSWPGSGLCFSRPLCIV